MAKQPTLFELRHVVPASEREIFEAFWEAYPRKVGKAEAMRAFRTALRQGADGTAIVRAVRAYPWPSDRKYIPYPATWLRRGSWEDDPREVQPESALMQAIRGVLSDG